MDLLSSLAIISFAALIHASFQLSVSVLTLLSGHAIGRQTAHNKLLRLTGGFLLGVGVVTLLLLSFVALILQLTFGSHIPLLVWATTCGLMLGLGVAVWVFYYRRRAGTSLWLPREIARFLNERAKATKNSAEGFSLGIASVFAELVFVFAPILIAALALTQLSPYWKIIGLAIYTLVSLLSLLITYMLIGSGHKLSTIQKWREDNKRFLQFAAGSGLIVLGFYVYVDQVIAAAIAGTIQ